MTYLLDTHTFLWQLKSPEVLPDRVSMILGDRSTTVMVSLVTPWEIAIKAKTGKLDAADILDRFEAKVLKAKFNMLETTVQHVIRGGSLPLHHRDPFDRLLIAQAFELRIPILSNDTVLDLYGVQRIWD
jgi:PIN domain nuclease of toxin-antitoxin system